MKAEKRAIYAGSFDPFHRGHLCIVAEACRIFDQLIIGIATNTAKKSFFSFEDKKEIVESYLLNAGLKNVEIAKIENQFLAKFAEDNKIDYLARGLRSGADFEYELSIHRANQKIGAVETVFFVPPQHLERCSSSLIRGFFGLDGWEQAMTDYVNQLTINKFKEKINKNA